MKRLILFFCGTLLFFASAILLNRYGNRDLMTVFLTLTLAAPLGYLIAVRASQRGRLLRLREESLRAELLLLKNQINPHFFFNTLNNLYGLAREKSDLAPLMILKLSDMMRFTIYEGRKDQVFLKDEIEYLRNYIELNEIRYREEVEIRFEEEIEDELVRIPPLMFIMLLENAFKHGASTLTEGAFIHIHLRADGTDVAFQVTNNYDPAGTRSKPGIGMINLQRRLALLYPDRHRMTAIAEDGVYTASLQIGAL
ncbi:Histidine kinase [Sulfidibacter corallicola]|uniref:Histidine kinase n=1 Tax=Sulfidibacter corallicola TaxID=2818388 RepID=A0A8A4TM61_SULCO|nr:histidine kinase [Sulfidibacter corallicola]QTD50202.1 histidine kinase [Sulfidibacter corallicola]